MGPCVGLGRAEVRRAPTAGRGSTPVTSGRKDFTSTNQISPFCRLWRPLAIGTETIGAPRDPGTLYGPPSESLRRIREIGEVQKVVRSVWVPTPSKRKSNVSLKRKAGFQRGLMWPVCRSSHRRYRGWCRRPSWCGHTCVQGRRRARVAEPTRCQCHQG